MKVVVWEENGVLCFRMEGAHQFMRSVWQRPCGARGYRLECKCGVNTHCIEVSGCDEHQLCAAQIDSTHAGLILNIVEVARQRGYGNHADIRKLEGLAFAGTVS